MLTPNAPPDAVYDAADVVGGAATAIEVLANDTDPDGDPLTVVGITQGSRGTVVNEGDRLIYTPRSLSGKDTLTYTISDGRGGSDSATVTIRLRAK